MNQNNEHGKHWWLGVADLLGTGLHHGADKLERVHLSLADETFNILERVPVTRRWSIATREVHHSVSRTSYRAVGMAADGLGRLARRHSTDSRPETLNDN